jgi:hypothetical protein
VDGTAGALGGIFNITASGVVLDGLAGGTGGVISRNVIHDTAQDGIAVYMGTTTVECNEVTGSTSENGGIYLAFAVSNVVVRHNWVHDNAFNVGKWGDPAGIMIGTAVNAAAVSVYENNLSANLPNGMTNKAGAVLVEVAVPLDCLMARGRRPLPERGRPRSVRVGSGARG